jgi:hypothetical protein
VWECQYAAQARAASVPADIKQRELDIYTEEAKTKSATLFSPVRA